MSVPSFSLVSNLLFKLTPYMVLMPYGYKQSRISCTPYPPIGEGPSATGAQNSDPSPQIFVGTWKNFVTDLADFGTQTEKGCPPLP